ncbi:hypothetical protein SEVIR_9G144266v4 [Setaria viridis]
MDRRDQGETATEENAGTVAVLPDDVLADILRRLPPRGLAASRCVSARRGAPSWTPTASCGRTSSRSRWAGSSSTSTTTTSRSSSPAPRRPAAPPSPASTTTCPSPHPVHGAKSATTAMALCW